LTGAMPSSSEAKSAPDIERGVYRGRLAPSPTGYLHVGHARTFWTAYQRAFQHNGILVFRNEDLDVQRSKKEFAAAQIEDLSWFGIKWQEGPDCGGPFGPYNQSERISFYSSALAALQKAGLVYPCSCSRKDVLQALSAPHQGDEEPIYPGTCRPSRCQAIGQHASVHTKRPFSWRFQVPDGECIRFEDGHFGPQQFTAGKDFGDFVVWRQDGLPSYQLAVVVDDHAMQITEVVRGADLLLSTARQLLLYRALGWTPPKFFHCPLVTDSAGIRLAKRHDALSLRELRSRGETPETIRTKWQMV